MNTSAAPRNTIARKPSHLGSYRNAPSEGSSVASFASIGSIGGGIAYCDAGSVDIDRFYARTRETSKYTKPEVCSLFRVRHEAFSVVSFVIRDTVILESARGRVSDRRYLRAFPAFLRGPVGARSRRPRGRRRPRRADLDARHDQQR